MEKLNGNTLWADSIKKELDAIMTRKTLYFPVNEAERGVMKEAIHSKDKFRFDPMWFLHDVKPINLVRKARISIGGNVVDTKDTETFSNMMSTEGSRVLAVIADHLNYDMAVGDVNMAYLYATTKEKIFSRAEGENCFINGYTTDGQSILCMVHKD